MDENVIEMLKLLSTGAGDKYDALQKLQQEPIRRGMRNQGQSAKDFFMNPTGAQNRAMLEFAGGILNRDRTKPGIAGINEGYRRGLDLMDEIRQREKDDKIRSATLDIAQDKDQWGRMTDMLKLAPKPTAPSKDRFQKVQVNVGTDPVTGQPITKEVMVNVDEQLRREGDTRKVVHDYSGQLAQQGEDAGVTPMPEAEKPPVTLENMPPPPARSGRTPEQNEELRAGTAQAVHGLKSLLEDMANPNLGEVVGIGSGGIVKGKMARVIETPGMAELAASVEHGMQSRAIPLAKQLGVNPTDFDFKQILKSAPKVTDGADVWRDWTYTEYLPFIVKKVEAQHGSEYAAALQEAIAAAPTPASAKQNQTVKWGDL